VTEVRSGPKALALIERGDTFDLMISDYAMPRIAGMQLAAAVRALRPGLPIILASGYAELPTESTLALQQLDKPYSLTDLAGKIERVMAERG
jgi:CheY-like chemotaxis protein